MAGCVRVDCDRPHYARGLCWPCYRSLHRKTVRLINAQHRRNTPHIKETPMAERPKRRDRKKAKPDPLAWLDYQQLQATLDDPETIDAGWEDQARCVNSSIDMFPESAAGVPAAKSVCETCPATYECLAYALMTSAAGADFGVWGRTSSRERFKIRRRVKIRVRSNQYMRGLRGTA